MYCVTILNKKTNRNVGPAFFSGSEEKYKTLADARKAAAEWINTQTDSTDLQIDLQIVGCL